MKIVSLKVTVEINKASVISQILQNNHLCSLCGWLLNTLPSQWCLYFPLSHLCISFSPPILWPVTQHCLEQSSMTPTTSVSQANEWQNSTSIPIYSLKPSF